MNNQLEGLPVSELLRRYGQIIDELKRRGVTRTANNPSGDYAEWLVARNLNLELLGNSNAGYDAIGPDHVKYQIKSRRVTPENKSRELGAIRGLDKQDFDYLVAVMFNADFTLDKVVKIPHAVIGEYARFTEHTNAHKLLLRGALLADERVQDITSLMVVTEPG
ncbi:MAG TPA: hypothetical protein VGE04_13705 [Chloroflexia bacterium]